MYFLFLKASQTFYGVSTRLSFVLAISNNFLNYFNKDCKNLDSSSNSLRISKDWKICNYDSKREFIILWF